MAIDYTFDSIDINKHLETVVKTESTKHMHPSFNLMNLVRLPTMCYYHIDREASTASDGNMTVASFIGEDSPVRYQKIENFIMYGFIEDLHKRDRSDVTGYQMIKRGASYIIGGVFEPLENSFFKVTIDNQDYLYQITSVEPLQDKDKPIYRLTHKVYVSSENSKYNYIDKQISTKYVYVHENLGTEYKVLVEYEIYNNVMQRFECAKYLQTEYIEAYYREDLNTFMCEDMDNPDILYYSDMLVEFIRKTNCIYLREHRTNIMLEHEIIQHRKFKYDFDRSTFGKMLRGEAFSIDTLFSKRKYIQGSNPFSPIDKIDNTIVNISLEQERLIEGANFPDDKIFTVNITMAGDSIFKKLYDLKMDISKLSFDDIRKYRIYSDELDAFLYTPIIIFLLINESENELTKRYNHYIADTLGVI